MSEIRELSSSLTDQIAAGEVIERPSSVVKELLENAIDAKSTKIKISVKNSGLSEIVIEDNGTGIDANQIDLAFKRHATSKILTKEDLFRVKTLGFRGEALASISAVSKVEMITATENGVGTNVSYQNGQKISQESFTAKKGTKIIISDLFYNTPARLKYLKSEKTELKNIIDIVDRIALSYPNLAISLFSDGKPLLETSGNGNLQQDIAQVYGRKIASEMIGFENENDDFKISGFMSQPDVNRANRSYISILLNGRYIKNYQINNAIIRGYGSKLPEKKFPIVVINIELDPLLVDVNVHPTKQEVRLSKEQVLTQLISNCLFETLEQKVNQANAIDNLQNPTNETEFDQLIFNLNKQLPTDIPDASENLKVSNTNFEVHEEVTELEINDPDQSYHSATWVQNVAIQKTLLPFGRPKSSEVVQTSGEEILNNPLNGLTYKTTLASGFVVADSTAGFYLIDIKNAQSRILFDQILKQLDQEESSQQLLLTPLVLEFSNLEYQQLQSQLDNLAKYGIVLEDFGGNAMILKAVPNFINSGDEENFVRQILAQNVQLADLKIAMAKNAIKNQKYPTTFNQTSGEKFIEALINSSDPYQSPNGKLILAQFKNRDLDKMFKRI